jgi:methyl-accepting chemotaxis protein
MAMSNIKKTIGINPFGSLEKKQSLTTKHILKSKEGGPDLNDLVDVIDDFTQNAESMSKTAHKLEKQTSHASAAAKQLTGNIQAVSVALDKVRNSSKKISTNINNSTKSSIAALKAADSTNAVFTNFLDSSKELDRIDKVVATLAQQINIFALNASIEAARSGEAGRGFTVVANEIKELSKETFKIADDIRLKIDTFFSDAKEAISTLSEISSLIMSIKNNQSTIETIIEEQTEATEEASRSNANITRTSNSVTDNILNVYKLSKLNNENIEKSIRISHSLNRIVEDMNKSTTTSSEESPEENV